MRKLWICEDWYRYITQGCLTGIRLHFDKNVNREVRRASIQFIYWLKHQYKFPIRVHIYFKSSMFVKCLNGDKASAIFFGPADRLQKPHIRIAVGDYADLLEKSGQDNALASILHSIAHELSHYFQWIKYYDEWLKDDDEIIKKFEKQAVYYSREIVFDYADVVEHP